MRPRAHYVITILCLRDLEKEEIRREFSADTSRITVENRWHPTVGIQDPLEDSVGRRDIQSWKVS